MAPSLVMRLQYMLIYALRMLRMFENTNQTHSMCKWVPKVSFPSITSALENLWPTQWSPFHYVTTNFGCADWHVKMSNDVQPFHRIKGTVRQPGHSLFSQHWSQSVFFHCIEEKLAWITGSFLILHTLRHNILLENPSSQPCIGKP